MQIFVEWCNISIHTLTHKICALSVAKYKENLHSNKYFLSLNDLKASSGPDVYLMSSQGFQFNKIIN